LGREIFAKGFEIPWPEFDGPLNPGVWALLSHIPSASSQVLQGLCVSSRGKNLIWKPKYMKNGLKIETE
jgi:hypothetical protein